MNFFRNKLRIFITFRDMKEILSNIKHVKHNLKKMLVSEEGHIMHTLRHLYCTNIVTILLHVNV
jgi:hypothetical protein